MKSVIKKKNKINDVEKFVDDISQKLTCEQSRNNLFSRNVTVINNKRNKSTESAISMVGYSKQLNERWKDVSGTVNMFESTIRDLRKSNEKKSSTFNNKKARLEGMSGEYTKQINAILTATSDREKRIRELDIKRDLLLREIEEEKHEFLEKENRAEIKRTEVEAKINELTKSYYDMTSSMEIKKSKIQESRKTMKKKERSFEEAQMRINEYMLKNDLLREQIRNLMIQISKPKKPSILKKSKSSTYYKSRI